MFYKRVKIISRRVMKNPYSSALILHRINLNPNLRIIPQTKNPTSVGLFSASERRDSNSRPSRWQHDALPAELLSQLYACEFTSRKSVCQTDLGKISKLLFFLKQINVDSKNQKISLKRVFKPTMEPLFPKHPHSMLKPLSKA